MAYELYGVLSGAVSLNTGEKVRPAYGGKPESFLDNVVTPIYTVLYEVQFNINFVQYWILNKETYESRKLGLYEQDLVN